MMVHDYHLYTLPAMVREARPDVFLHHFIHIPWTQPDAWRVLPTAMRDEIYRGRAGQRHHRLPHALLPAQLPAVLPRPDGPRGRLRERRRPRATTARCGCAPTRCRSTTRPRAASPAARACASSRSEVLRAAARVLDPARGPRGPLQERPARVHRVRHLPRAAPGVRRADHVHGPADAVADRRAGVRRVPGEDRGAGRRRQPPPRHAGLDADRPQAARRPRRGGRLLQALRRDDGQRDVRRHEPRGQGRAAGQRAPRRLDPVARTPARTRSSASSRSR